MSLKGYEWLNGNGEVVMSFRFKDLSLDIVQDTTKEELDKFIEWLKQQGENTYYIHTHAKEIRTKRV